MTKSKKKRTPRSTAKFSTLDDFLKCEGKLEEFQSTAIKEMAAVKLTKR
jgi:hypothetical protein